MKLQDLLDMYNNGEIDADEFTEMHYGKLGFDVDVSYEKPKKTRMTKKMKKGLDAE
jgi:hypothetical protein